MYAFIDTSNKDICIALLDETLTCVGSKIMRNIHNKVEVLPALFAELMSDIGVKVSDVRRYYVCIGPGRFTGSRIGLVYVRTIAQLTRASVYTITSLELAIISSNITDGRVCARVSARALICADIQGSVIGQKRIIEDSKTDPSTISYQHILDHFTQIHDRSVAQYNLLDVDIAYDSKPHIG